MSIATAEKVTFGVIEAWALYRRSQLLPASPDLLSAQAALLRLLEPHTRTYGGGLWPWDGPDLEAIEDAADLLVVLVEFRIDTETASVVAGDNEVAAA
jgi:hypothetical protein